MPRSALWTVADQLADDCRASPRADGGRAGYGADQVDKCDPWHVGKRPSFIETATNRLSFLVDEQGLIG